MEQQISRTSQIQAQSQTSTARSFDWNTEIPIGTPVIYGLHGKCTVVGIEERELAGQTQRFYKLEKQRSSFSRSQRIEPAIWLPVSSAHNRGLRSPMTQEDLESAFQILSSREHYFSVKDSWHSVQTKIEETIRMEGCIGVAKALSFFFVLKRRQIVPHPEVNKLSDAIQKNFIREVSELTRETSKEIELKMARSMKYKLLADQ
jgi:RNA polymerase-interacting CarD/CdnL/TRCF family regulator